MCRHFLDDQSTPAPTQPLRDTPRHAAWLLCFKLVQLAPQVSRRKQQTGKSTQQTSTTHELSNQLRIKQTLTSTLQLSDQLRIKQTLTSTLQLSDQLRIKQTLTSTLQLSDQLRIKQTLTSTLQLSDQIRIKQTTDRQINPQYCSRLHKHSQFIAI